MAQGGSLRKRGDNWTAYWFVAGPDGTRRQRSKGGFKTKREAQGHLTAQLSALQTGAYQEPTQMTLAQYLTDEWLPTKSTSVKASTFAAYSDELRGRVVPRIGGQRLSAITPRMLTELQNDLLANGGRDPKRSPRLAPKSVRNTMVALGKALDDAVRLGHIPRNPPVDIDAPRVTRREMLVWTADEAGSFLQHVQTDRLRALWVLLLTTGMRRGEALGLKWGDIDFNTKRLSIQRALVTVGYTPQWSDPKSAKGKRNIALDQGTVSELRQHRRRQDAEREAWGTAYHDAGLVFSREDGQLINPQLVSQAFERHLKAAGVAKIRLHDLRHTSASLALAAGVHPKVVSERLGHATISITLDLYSHVLEGLQDEAAAALGEMILGEPTPDQGDDGPSKKI